MSKPQNKVEKEQLDLILAYKKTFESESGTKVLNDLIKRHMLKSSMNDNDSRVIFGEGERNVVLTILAILNITEDNLRERIANVKKA